MIVMAILSSYSSLLLQHHRHHIHHQGLYPHSGRLPTYHKRSESLSTLGQHRYMGSHCLRLRCLKQDQEVLGGAVHEVEDLLSQLAAQAEAQPNVITDAEEAVDWVNNEVHDPMVEVDPVTVSRQIESAKQYRSIKQAEALFTQAYSPPTIPNTRNSNNVRIAFMSASIVLIVAALLHLLRSRKGGDKSASSSGNMVPHNGNRKIVKETIKASQSVLTAMKIGALSIGKSTNSPLTSQADADVKKVDSHEESQPFTAYQTPNEGSTSISESRANLKATSGSLLNTEDVKHTEEFGDVTEGPWFGPNSTSTQDMVAARGAEINNQSSTDKDRKMTENPLLPQLVFSNLGSVLMNQPPVDGSMELEAFVDKPHSRIVTNQVILNDSVTQLVGKNDTFISDAEVHTLGGDFLTQNSAGESGFVESSVSFLEQPDLSDNLVENEKNDVNRLPGEASMADGLVHADGFDTQKGEGFKTHERFANSILAVETESNRLSDGFQVHNVASQSEPSSMTDNCTINGRDELLIKEFSSSVSQSKAQTEPQVFDSDDEGSSEGEGYSGQISVELSEQIYYQEFGSTSTHSIDSSKKLVVSFDRTSPSNSDFNKAEEIMLIEEAYMSEPDDTIARKQLADLDVTPITHQDAVPMYPDQSVNGPLHGVDSINVQEHASPGGDPSESPCDKPAVVSPTPESMNRPITAVQPMSEIAHSQDPIQTSENPRHHDRPESEVGSLPAHISEKSALGTLEADDDKIEETGTYKAVEAALPAIIGVGTLLGVAGGLQVVGFAAVAGLISSELLWADKRASLWQELKGITNREKLEDFLAKRNIVKKKQL